MSVTDLQTLPARDKVWLRGWGDRLEAAPILTYGDMQEILMELMKRLEPLGLLALRLVLGLIFLTHGFPKLAHPTEAMHEFFVAHGLPAYFVSVAGVIECFGSVLLFAGLFTRPAALLLTIEMSVAIWKVHSVNGIMSVKDYEFPLSLAAGCFVLATVGAGLISADHVLLGENGKTRRSSKSSRE